MNSVSTNCSIRIESESTEHSHSLMMIFDFVDFLKRIKCESKRIIKKTVQEAEYLLLICAFVVIVINAAATSAITAVVVCSM